MKKYFLELIKRGILPLIAFLVFSCGLKSVPSEYTFIENGLVNVELSKLGNGKILIYNGAGFLYKMDNTGELNIWIDGKSLGQLRTNEYVVIDLEKGKRKFEILHFDVVNMGSKKEVEIDEHTKIIRIKPNLFSNRLSVTNKMPGNFAEFRYAKK
ncbi:hypothetical protein Flavo103_06880 [Flavobacterium collinsii]|uniref:hypothetical protein n=1 Tax=Flavobacterium collinsii TaxID=1114861 RepID=UPI0022CAF8CD|nr:hypothetical protein [Flavobacterium collinsii]GIQ57552.1 hypothetical protein Flavo103_06880 [Flavobacterium collinsii]